MVITAKREQKFYRHGDLLIKRIKELPSSVQASGIHRKEEAQEEDQQQQQQLQSYILAKGETTGHAHVLRGSQIQVFKDTATTATAATTYLKLEQSAELVHEEHKPITIEKGIYVIVREREYNPFSEAIRQVVD